MELFLDPGQPWIQLKIARRLLQKKLGFRMLMDVIPLDANLVRGSHGLAPVTEADAPILISPAPGAARLESTDVFGLIRELLLDAR